MFLFGHFGLGNLGNESTLQAMIGNLRRLVPDAELICICTGPDITRALHKIETIPIHPWVSNRRGPRRKFLRWMRTVFIGIPLELLRWVYALKLLRRGDIFIIPGTGLLNDAYTLRGWGPYGLFKWCTIARLRGCKVLFVSVGAGPLRTHLGCGLAKAALRLGNFRSYRDVASLQYLRNLGFARSSDRVYPDLAFSLPQCLASEMPQPLFRRDGRKTVGIGAMLLNERYSTSQSDQRGQSYIETLTGAITFLIENGYNVRLLIGDFSDRPVVENVKGLVVKRLPPELNSRILDDRVDCVEGLLAQIAQTDLVIATRFHNILLGLMLNKPTIALSFHHKCAALMSEMGLSEYCLDIHNLELQQLIAKILVLEQNAAVIGMKISERTEACRAVLEEQYRLISQMLGSSFNLVDRGMARV